MERRERYDVVVAGGGPAGCAVAARLSENGDRSVCLVEAGPDYGPRGGDRWPEELLDATGIPETHDWRDEAGSLPWARVIGGCSAHNACFITRAPRTQYESWARFGGAAWSYDKLLPCLRRADRQLAARPLNADELGAWQRGVLDAAAELGLARSDDADLAEPRASPARVNTDGTTRFNASFAYLDPCRERPNLDVLADSVAERVLVDGDRTVGLIARNRGGGEIELASGSVIVCCGSYGSPALLLRSGIGPPDELSRHGIEVRVELPGVGANLADHPRFVVGFALEQSFSPQLDSEGRDRRMVAQVLVIARSGANDELCDLHLFPVLRPLGDGGYEGRISVGGLAPHSRGRVLLASADPWALPAVDHGFLTDERDVDLNAMLGGIDLARALVSTSALRGNVAAEVEPGRLERDRLVDALRAGVATYYHPTGSCRMGADDDPMAVVDPGAQVRGIEGLQVADASIIPVLPQAQTHLTTLAVAERVCELIDGR